MYQRTYNMPAYRNVKQMPNQNINNTSGGYYDERGFWIPFVVGGLAGASLGYGVANNNFLSHNQGFYPPMRPCCTPYSHYQMPYPYY